MSTFRVRTYDGYEQDFTSLAAARAAAKAQVQIGNRGCSECGTPMWAGDTDYDAYEAWVDRDGDEDSPIAIIEVIA